MPRLCFMRLDGILKNLIVELESAEIACKGNPCGDFGVCEPIKNGRMNFRRFVCNCLKGYVGDTCDRKV